MNNNKSNGVDKHTILPEQSLKDLINYCGSVLNLTSEEIKAKYPAHIQNHFEYIHKDKPQETLELYLEKESATITCEFDKLGYCIYAYIFFDTDIPLEEYKSVLNTQYKYKWFKRKWKTPTCYLSVLALDDLVYVKCMKK